MNKLAVVEQSSLGSQLDRERAALDAVLGSATFARSPRLSALLKYVCERYFSGETDSIKEYSLATEVLGRPPDFDQARDAIVRVEAHRLRRKLAEYYRSEGSGQNLRITIQRGHYIPEFVLDESYLERQETPESSMELLPALERPADELFGKRQSAQWVRLVAGALALAALLAVALFLIRVTPFQGVRNFAQAQMDRYSGEIPAVPVRSGFAEVRLLCGDTDRDYKDPYGNIWSRDRYFKGGKAGYRPQEFFFRTTDSRVFQHTRTGEFSYDIPLKPGIYELTLYFAETELGARLEMRGGEGRGGEGDRLFDVVMNGRTILRAFDILSDADGPNIADRRVFKDVKPASDGYLHLRFTGYGHKAQLSAIKIVPGIANRLLPIRFVTQQIPYTDGSGNLWAADSYYMGGRQTFHRKLIGGSIDQGLFAAERYGHFSYAIPVDSGSYTLNLYLAETFFGANNPGGGGMGSRVFNVLCNGNTLLRDLDIFREAGENQPLVRTFRGLRPNPEGKLMLTFEPVVNYADVYAIEVLDEGR